MKMFIKWFQLILMVLILTGCTKISEEKRKLIQTAETKITEFKLDSTTGLDTVYDFSGTTINYYNADTVDNTDYQKTEDDTPFKIIDHGPEDELPADVKRPTIYVLFSQPVVPIGKLGEVMKTSQIMKINPVLPGIYRWYGTKLLSFEPDSAVLPQKIYTITIDQKLKSLGGKKLEGKNSFSFHSEYLSVTGCYPSGTEISPESAGKITIHFKYPVNLDVIKEYIRLTVNNKKVDFKLNRPKKTDGMTEDQILKSVEVKLQQKVPEKSKVIVTILKGAKSEAGYIGTKWDIEHSFSTISEFRYLNYRIDSYSYPKSTKGDANPVFLNFSHPVDQKSLKDNLQVSLTVNNLNNLVECWDKTVKISNLPVTYNSTYTITVKAGIKDIYGRSLDKASEIKITVPPASRYYYFPNSGTRILEAFYSPKIAYEYQNVFDGVWNVKKVEQVYDSKNVFNKDELKAYDFSNLKKNTKHIEILNLTPWLNKDKKGFIAFSWNFSNKEIPYQISYQSFHDQILSGISDNSLYKKLTEEWFYTNNQQQYYWSKNSYLWDADTREQIEKIFNNAGYELERSSYRQNNLELQVTDLAVTVRAAYNQFVIMVSSLSTGLPVTGADVSIKKNESFNIVKSGFETNKEGVAVIPFELNEFVSLLRGYSPIILVKKGSDKVEFMPNNSHNSYHFGVWSTQSAYNIEKERPVTFMFTDRGLYRPGETVSYRGIDRNLKLGEYTSYTGGFNIMASDYHYSAKPFFQETGTTTVSGGFSGSFTIPDDLKPGYYNLVYKRGDHYSNVSFQVANFRRLAFQVKINAPNLTYYNKDALNPVLQAEYLAGGALKNAACDYYWTKKSARYKPDNPNYKSYRFGIDKIISEQILKSKKENLDNLGKLAFQLNTSGQDDAVTYQYIVSAKVEDIDRQVIQANKSFIVHPAAFYIGTKFSSNKDGWWSPFVNKGESVTVDYVLLTPEGDPYLPGDNRKLTAKLYYLEWKVAQQQGVYDRINSRYNQVETLTDEQQISLNGEKGSFSIKPKEVGQYFLELSAEDSSGRTAVTRLPFYVTGSTWYRWNTENVNDINLIADKNIYKPGETVHLMVQSPLQKGRYLVTIEREGIIEEKVIELTGSANIIEIPVKKEYLPVFYIALASYSVRDQAPPASFFETDLGKPKGYFGLASIMVSTEIKEIELTVTPEKNSFLPGTNAQFTLIAMNKGKPLADTEITFLAVDRGVVDLINYHVPNPLEYFYHPNKFPLAVFGGDSRSLLIDPVTYEVKDLQGGDGDEKMQKRSDFRPTAVFIPYLKTDDQGIVKLDFKLPDNLTTYRCTVIAVNQDLFGIKEAEIMVQNPINVRTALPRKLRLRDTSFAGVVLTNLDNQDHQVEVSLQSDMLFIEGDSVKTVTIKSNNSLEVPFRIAAKKTGEAVLVFTIHSVVLNEQLEVKLEVERPYVKEAFTTIGETMTDGSQNSGQTIAKEGFILPVNIADNFGSLSIALNTTRMSNISESIHYLYSYPFWCLEQRSSKITPLIMFGEKVQPFLNIDKAHLKRIVEDEIEEWSKYQNSDGGFPFWLEGGYPSGRFISIKVAKLLYFAKKNGFKIPEMINIGKLLDYIALPSQYEHPYLDYYSLYVQSLHGRNVFIKAEDIFRKLGNDPSALAFIGLTFLNNGHPDNAGQCFTRLKNLIKAGTQTIDLVDPKTRHYFCSQINELSLLIMLCDQLDPSSYLIQKTINTLMQRQKYGFWSNTVSTEWVIQAFSQIFNNESGHQTDLEAKVTIGEQEVLNQIFKGVPKDTFVKTLDLNGKELSQLKRGKLFPVMIETQGTGKLYYTETLRYALPTEIIQARDEGFSIFTQIYELNGNPVKDETRLKLGKTYQMKALISSPKVRKFVAARIPIPSGAEVLDASFVTTAVYQEAKQNEQKDWWYYYGPNELKYIMDNEVQYMFNNFREGRQEVQFLFRTTSPGIFPTPPSTVECMYEEEVFGRTAGKLYTIM